MTENKQVNYGICPTCGKYYTTFMGSMAHAQGACEGMVDQKEQVLARLTEEAQAAQARLDAAQG